MTPQGAQKQLEKWHGRRVVVGHASWWEGSRSWCSRNRANSSRWYAFAVYDHRGPIMEPVTAFRTLQDLTREAMRLLPKDDRVYM